MSKKMLKRSMALGALMAFVITGSAMAAETLNITEGTDYSAAVKNSELYVAKSKDDSVVVNGNNLTVSGVAKVEGVKRIFVGSAEGESVSAEASNNSAVISDSAVVSADIYVGQVEGKKGVALTAKENSITVKDNAEVKGSIVSAYAVDTNITSTQLIKNSVTLEGNVKVESVAGAFAAASSQKDDNTVYAEGNTVTIRGTTEVNANEGKGIDGRGSEKIHGVYGAFVKSYSSDNGATEASSTATAKGNIVNVIGGTVNGNIYGAYAEAHNYMNVATLNANANGNTVNLSGGKVKGNVYGGYSLKTPNFSELTEKQSVAGTASNNTVNISGTANVENANLYGNNGGEGTGNALNIKDGWSGSIGSAQNFDVINITEGASASFKTALNDANATVNVKGATWNVDATSNVGSASFDASSVLNIDGATFEAKDGNTAYALNGTGELKVAEGATLKIEGIDYKKYNVANGFSSIVDGNGENFADGDEYWKLENTLMQGIWTTDNGLQVEIKAKEAEDLATEMGVSVNIANTMTEIINVANSSDLDKEAPEVQKVVEFANALAAATSEEAGQAIEAVAKMAEASGTSATAAKVVANVTGVTNQRLSFGGGHRGGHKGGHGVGLFEEGSGAAIWAQYVHGKDSVEDMPSTAGASSYEGQHNGIVMGVDFKKVGKFQSGVAFNYGEGDTNSVATSARTKSEYDFWGIGYYGNIRNEDTNVIFDLNYAKTDSDVTTDVVGQTFEASPETTTWTAGVKVEKLYQNNNVQIVPYTGLRFMSIDTDDYSTKCGANQYKMERQDIWLLPLGVSIKQEVVNDNGWVVTPKVDLSYIWAFGDTDSNMEFTTLDIKTPVGYEVMDDGSWLGLVGVEATMDDWTFGVSYSYQKGDHSESKKWYVDAKYSF